jgi:hypothetical protein
VSIASWLSKAFNPNQPRDEHGRWTKGGRRAKTDSGIGGSSVTPQWVAGLNDMPEITDQIAHADRSRNWANGWDGDIPHSELERRLALSAAVDMWQGGAPQNGGAYAYQIRDIAKQLVSGKNSLDEIKPYDFGGGETDPPEIVEEEYLAAQIVLEAVHEAPQVKKTLYRGMILSPDFVEENLQPGDILEDPVGSWSGKPEVAQGIVEMRTRMGQATPNVTEDSTERVVLVSDQPKALNVTPLNTDLAPYKLKADEYLSGGRFEVVKVEKKRVPRLAFRQTGDVTPVEIEYLDGRKADNTADTYFVHVRQKSTFDPHRLVDDVWDSHLHKAKITQLPDYVPAGLDHWILVQKYSPDQPRDEHGRWTKGGSHLRPIDTSNAKLYEYDPDAPEAEEAITDFHLAEDAYMRWVQWEGVRQMRHAAEHLLGTPDSFSDAQELQHKADLLALDYMREVSAKDPRGKARFTDYEWENALEPHQDEDRAKFILSRLADPSTDKTIVLENELDGEPLSVGVTEIPLYRGVGDMSEELGAESSSAALASKSHEWMDHLLSLKAGDTIDFGLVAASPERVTAESFARSEGRSAFLKFLPGTKVFTADDINFEAITSGRFEVVRRLREQDRSFAVRPEVHDVFELKQVGVFEVPGTVRKNVGDHIERLPNGSYRRTDFDGLFDTPLPRPVVKFGKASKPLGSRFFGKDWQEQTYERMIQVGTQELAPHMAQALSDLFAYITENGLLADVLRQLDNGSLNNIEINLLSAIARIDIPPDVVQQFLSDAFASGVSINVDALRGRAKEKNVNFDMRFDMVNPYAVEWAYRQGAALVVNITQQTQNILRTHIEDALINGHSPRELAKMIRRYVGLDPRWARAVDRYEDGLKNAGNLRPGQISQMVNGYAERLRKARALRIARTEILRAQNVGQSAVWIEMAKVGLIDRNLVRKQWIVTRDDKLCKYCQRMEDESLAFTDLHGWFQTPLGLVFEPPMHPNCRCTQVLDVPDPLDLVQMLHLDDETGYEEVKKYSPDQPRDEHGRWTRGLTAYATEPSSATQHELNHKYISEVQQAFPTARIEVELEEPNARSMQGVAAAAVALARDYPTTAKHIKHIVFGPINGSNAIGRQNTSRDGITIEIDTVGIATQHMITMGEDDPAGTYGLMPSVQHAAEAVFTHEFAHAIYSMAEAQVISAQWKKDGYVPKPISGFGAIQTKLVLGYPVNADHQQDFKTVVSHDLASRYGRKNPAEMWAEEFTMDRFNVREDRLGPLYPKYRDWYVNVAEHDGLSPQEANDILSNRSPYSKARAGGFLHKADEDLGDDFEGSWIFDRHAFDDQRTVNVEKGFDPNQPRDERGRWTAGSSHHVIDIPAGTDSEGVWKSILAPGDEDMKPEEVHPDRYLPARFGFILREGQTERRTRHVVGEPPQWEDITTLPQGMSVDDWKGEFAPYATGEHMRPLVKVPGSQRPKDFVYRVVSDEDYQNIVRTGFIKSDGRMNLGDEGTVYSDRSTGSFYMPPKDHKARIVRVRLHPSMKVDSDSYIKTHEPVPADYIDAVSPPMVWRVRKVTDLGTEIGNWVVEGEVNKSMLSWLKKYSPSQKREPKGSSKGGQFARTLSPIEGEGAPHELSTSALEEAASGVKSLKGKAAAAIKRFESKIAPRKTAIKRTLAAIEAASPADFKEGKDWYAHVHDWSGEIAKKNKMQPEQVRGVIAAFSPGYHWDAEVAVIPFLAEHVRGRVKLKDVTAVNEYLDKQNLDHVKNGDLLSDHPLETQARVLKYMYEEERGDSFYASGLRYGYDGVMKGIALLQAKPKDREAAEKLVNACLHGPKVRSFYNSIVKPDGNDVTADVWMLRVFTGDYQFVNDSTVTSTPSFTPKVGGASYPIGMYPVAADVVREAARQWNEKHPDKKLSAPEAQAIAWTHIRNTQPNKASRTKIKNFKRKNHQS